MRLDYIDGVWPAPLRQPAERRVIARADARRARGDYALRPNHGQGNKSKVPIEETEAWRIYQEQLAAGLGVLDDDEPPPPRREYPPKRRVPNHLASVRESRGMSQRDLEEISGVSRRTIRRVEGGGVSTWRTKIRLIAALDVPVDRIGEVFPGLDQFLIEGERDE